MKEWFLSVLNKLMPPDTPRIIRQFAKWTFIFFAFFGILISFKPTYPVQMFSMFLMFLFLACVTSLSVVLAFRLLTLMTGKTNLMKLDQMYEKEGFTPDMGFICKHSNPFGYGRERILASFLYMMCEDYPTAREQYAQADNDLLSERLLAMKHVIMLRIAALSGNLDRADQLFAQNRLWLDSIYMQTPLLTDRYRPYLDDALVYYMLAAVLSQRAGDYDAVESYRLLVQQRLRDMEDAQAHLTEEAFALSLLYAEGRLEEADSYAKQLEGEISTANMLPQGKRSELLRMLGQARIYADFASTTAAGLDVSRERPLPAGTDLSVPPISKEHGEHPDDMASIPYL